MSTHFKQWIYDITAGVIFGLILLSPVAWYLTQL